MKYLKVIIIFTLGILSGSCEKILQPKPRGQVALENLLTTQEGIITAVNGAYEPLMGLYNGITQRLTDLAGDDGWTWRNELEPDIYVVDPNFLHSQNVWIAHYRGITRTNTVLDHLQNVEDFEGDEIRNAVEGQAKFLRAFYYFNLVRLFGGVPLILNEVKSREDAELPRASIPEVYARIKTDLEDAVSLLPVSYSGEAGMDKGRATAYAAGALKALVHLELEEWDEAAAATEGIMGHGSLLDNYADYFNGSSENGPGTLFEVQYAAISGSASNLSNFFAPSTFRGSALILPTDESFAGTGGGPSSGNSFVQEFEPGDLRKDVIIRHYDLPNFIDASRPAGSLFYVNKYYNTSDPVGLSSWNFPLIRYAEVILARAEALNENGYIADGEAFELLNAVRVKAGLAAFSSADLPGQDAFRGAVRQERRIEFAFEAKRYFDLNRWGILETAIQPQLDFLHLKFPSEKTITHPTTGKKYYLYPIPSTEFINNAQLGEQNPGY